MFEIVCHHARSQACECVISEVAILEFISYYMFDVRKVFAMKSSLFPLYHLSKVILYKQKIIIIVSMSS